MIYPFQIDFEILANSVKDFETRQKAHEEKLRLFKEAHTSGLIDTQHLVIAMQNKELSLSELINIINKNK